MEQKTEASQHGWCSKCSAFRCKCAPEASQAVEPLRAALQEILDIEEIRLWLIEKDHFSHVYWFKSKQEDYAARSAGLLDKVRAALKAQPAPTEAAQGNTSNNSSSSAQGDEPMMEYFKLALGALAMHNVDEALNIAGKYRALVPHVAQPSGNTGESGNKQVLENIEQVQGEDSARLDADRYRWLCEKFGVTWLPCFLEDKLERGYIEDGKESIDAAIDRARASAETGGVK